MKLPITYPSLDPTAPTPAIVHGVVQMFQRIAVAFNNPDHGATAARPNAFLTIGQSFFDTTLGYPVYWNGTHWVDGGGTIR